MHVTTAVGSENVDHEHRGLGFTWSFSHDLIPLCKLEMIPFDFEYPARFRIKYLTLISKPNDAHIGNINSHGHISVTIGA